MKVTSDDTSSSPLIKHAENADLSDYIERDLARIVIAGSVDDGKSTLLGRLLYEALMIPDDQMEEVRIATRKAASQKHGPGDDIDFAFVTDGLMGEREQAITIDVGYRHLSTRTRRYIIADTPGHEQYTRSMATGASMADIAVILIDVQRGISVQSRRHAVIAALFGVQHLVVVVNKMDLVGWDRSLFDSIAADFGGFIRRLGFRSSVFIPVCALRGHNVVSEYRGADWWTGGALLALLDRLPVSANHRSAHLRFPVQHVIRGSHSRRILAGQLASGSVRVGDAILALPSGIRTHVQSIDTPSGSASAAAAPLSISVTLTDDIDVGRGDMLSHPDHPSFCGCGFDAMIVWLSEQPLDSARRYLLKHTTRLVTAQIDRVVSVIDPASLAATPATALRLNDIGRVVVRTAQALCHDSFAAIRTTGAFILIDPIHNTTIAAGMIEDAEGSQASPLAPPALVTPAERRSRIGHRGAVIRVYDRSSPAARALAAVVERRLFDEGIVALLLDTGEEDAAVTVERSGVVAVVSSLGSPGASIEIDSACCHRLQLEAVDGIEFRAIAVVTLLSEKVLRRSR